MPCRAHASAACRCQSNLPERALRRVQASADASEQRWEEPWRALQLLPPQKLQAHDKRGCHVSLLLHRQLLDAPLRPPSLRKAQSDWSCQTVSVTKYHTRSIADTAQSLYAHKGGAHRLLREFCCPGEGFTLVITCAR